MRQAVLAAVFTAIASLLACKSDAPKDVAPAASLAQGMANDAAAPTAPPISSALARLQLGASMRTTDYCVAVRDVYWKQAKPETLRAYFPPGPAGDAPASALTQSIAEAMGGGANVERFEVRSAHAAEGSARSTVEVFEWVKKNGEDRCRTYVLGWVQQGDALYRDGAPTDVRDAKCPGGA